jgi:hypothetical protein
MPSRPVAVDQRGLAFFQEALRMLDAARIPFLVGGAYAAHVYTGIHRNTRDFDVFVRPEHSGEVLELFRRSGYRTELTFHHWLGKIHHRGYYVDVIFSSGNGVCEVDDAWFAHATPAEVLGKSVLLCPVEEMIWSKAFIMERERFDGADIMHLIRANADRMDWDRLVARFGKHSRILLAHLVVFGFVYPRERDRIPSQVMSELIGRLDDTAPVVNGAEPCQGTLLSRSQYIPDLEWGYRDGRLPPYGNMTPEEVEAWTDAASEEVDLPQADSEPEPEA